MTGNNKTKTTSANKGGVLKFFRGVKAEIKKISWPSKDETKKALIAVAIFAGIYLILIGGLDYIFQNLFELILDLK